MRGTAPSFLGIAHSLNAMNRIPGTALAAASMMLVAGCATLPDTDFLSERHAAQAARFESARGPLSAKQGATVVAELKRKSGDLDILDKQIALEQDIVGSALVVGNTVVLLQDGPSTYKAMLAAIAAARNHVNVESYIIEDGEVGEQFAQALLERQSHGVQVNVIYDSVGAFDTPKAYFERLTQAGIRVVEFNPLNPLTLAKSWTPSHRDHRKLMVIDGRTAFLGGINISNVYSQGSSVRRNEDEKPDMSSGWRDTDIQIDGPAVAEFQRLFMQTWEKQNGPPLAQRDYFPTLAPRGNDIVRAVGSTPDDPYSLIYMTLVSAITNAERQVYITNAYFVPDPQLVKALLDAAARGVDVRLMLPKHSDSAMVYYAARSHYTELLAGGVKIYERHGALLHAKTAVVDGVWSWVGSSNLDSRSALENDEINAVILGREFGQRMQAAYALDILASDAIDREGWERRLLLLRMKEFAARLWARML
jgi:cardiolipin synthase